MFLPKTVLWEDVLLRTNSWCFSLGCFVKEHVMFHWNKCLRSMWCLGKYISQKTVDTVALVHLEAFCWSSLGFADTGPQWQYPCIGAPFLTDLCLTRLHRNTSKKFWWYSGCFLLFQRAHANLQSLVVSSGFSCCYWFLFAVCWAEGTAAAGSYLVFW